MVASSSLGINWQVDLGFINSRFGNEVGEEGVHFSCVGL